MTLFEWLAYSLLILGLGLCITDEATKDVPVFLEYEVKVGTLLPFFLAILWLGLYALEH